MCQTQEVQGWATKHKNKDINNNKRNENTIKTYKYNRTLSPRKKTQQNMINYPKAPYVPT